MVKVDLTTVLKSAIDSVHFKGGSIYWFVALKILI